MTSTWRVPSRMKTSWYWMKMSGWPASEGVLTIADMPSGPWHDAQVWTSSATPGGGSAARLGTIGNANRTPAAARAANLDLADITLGNPLNLTERKRNLSARRDADGEITCDAAICDS